MTLLPGQLLTRVITYDDVYGGDNMYGLPVS